MITSSDLLPGTHSSLPAQLISYYEAPSTKHRNNDSIFVFGVLFYKFFQSCICGEIILFFLQVNYLKEFGLSTEDVGKLLAFKPQLMACSIEERWKPLVKYLYYLGISRDGMRRMLTIKPMVFCIDLEETIVPKV